MVDAENTDWLRLEGLDHQENFEKLPPFSKLVEETFEEKPQEVSLSPDSITELKEEMSPDFLLKNARTLLEARETTAAKSIFYCLLRKGDISAATYAGLGTCFELEGKVDKAMIHYQEAAKLDPSPPVLLAISDLYLRKGDYKAAVQSLLPALQMQGLAKKDLFKIYKSLGNVYFRLNDWEEARTYYSRANEMEPYSDVLYSNMACLALNRGKVEESALFFKRAIEINPENQNAITGLGFLHVLQNKKEKAIEFFMHTLKKDRENGIALFYLLKCAYEVTDASKVIPFLDAFISENKVGESALYSFAGLLYKEKEWKRAKAVSSQILSFHPEHEGAKKLLQLLSRARGMS